MYKLDNEKDDALNKVEEDEMPPILIGADSTMKKKKLFDCFFCWFPSSGAYDEKEEVAIIEDIKDDDGQQKESESELKVDNPQIQLVPKRMDVKMQDLFLVYGVIIPIGLFFYNLVNGRS